MPARRATYRFQLSAEFPLTEAAALADYLAALGISHVYASPVLQAAAGSSHGYDVADPTRVSDDLGGEGALVTLREQLRVWDMGLMVDIVPNHMATSDAANVWWFDVLEDGRSSPFADFFDIDWSVDHPLLRDRVLLPVLGDRLGRVLDHGDLAVVRDGGLYMQYFDEHLPLSPESVADILERVDAPHVRGAAAAIRTLPKAADADVAAQQRRRTERIEVGRQVLDATEREAGAVDALLAELNNSAERLNEVVQAQHYRLAHWRLAAEEVNYRRFFDVTTLVGLREENRRTFDEVHQHILELVSSGTIDGLRVDHIDGLRLPADYLAWLRSRTGDDCWIVVEKILGAAENLPKWPVAGTTGYDFADRVLRLHLDPVGLRQLRHAWNERCPDDGDLGLVELQSKRLVMADLLSADIARLTRLLSELCAADVSCVDIGASEIERALVEFIAAMPVYRTYATASGISPEDGAVLALTVDRALSSTGTPERAVVELIARAMRAELDHPAARELLLRLPQVTAAVSAKGVEDTAFYRYLPLVALDEVGGDPGSEPLDTAAFHQASLAALQHPHALLASSTHDTKRSEDVRARLAVLTEIPDSWVKRAAQWTEQLHRHWDDVGWDEPTVQLLLQTLVGAHPLDVERAVAYMRKAASESKRRTSWLHPDGGWSDGMEAFVRSALADADFTASLDEFCTPLIRWGRLVSLSQTLLKLTTPGVADIYQGCELWDLSLVDPDNRRPVDYALRRRLLAELGREGGARAAMERADTGSPKLLVIQRGLQLRRRHAAAFEGDYSPLTVAGEHGDCAVAFSRGGDDVCVVVPRMVTRLDSGWGNTTVQLPKGRWREQFSGRALDGGDVPMSRLLEEFPVALLERHGD